MGLTDLQLIFDNPQRTYFSGETVSGRLVVKNHAPEHLGGIIVDFKGMTSFLNKYGYEEHFKESVKVFGGHGKTEVLENGEHSFQFNVILPDNLPSSFKGELFHTSYRVKATLHRPRIFDQKVKAFFTVLTHLDLTLDPKNKESVKIENSKYFGCSIRMSGPITLATHIPSRGYVPGQSIPMTIEVDNASDVKVYEIACEILMICTYYGNREIFKCSTVCASLKLQGVKEYNSRTWASKLTVPQLPPSSHPHCKIIDVNYILKVKAKPRGLHFALENSIPIIIGTIPVWQDTSFQNNA